MKHSFNYFKWSMYVLVVSDLDAMFAQSVRSHGSQEEGFATDFAQCFAGICEIVADLAIAEVLRNHLKRCRVVALHVGRLNNQYLAAIILQSVCYIKIS